MKKSTEVGYPLKLEISRLLLRPNVERDIDHWTRFMSSEACLEYFPAYQQGNPEDHATKWIEKQIGNYDAGKYGMLSVIEKDTGAYVGQCGLLHQSIDGAEELEIGYSLLHYMWGKGYATEAGLALKNWAFDHQLVPSLISIIHRDNDGSKKVAKRLGMTMEKELTWKELPISIYRVFDNET